MEQTPSYVKKAVDNYRSKYDFIQVRLPKGTKERMKGIDNVNEYIASLILSDLERIESSSNLIYESPDELVPASEKLPEPITESRELSEEELERICEAYSRDYILSIIGQLEIVEKFGQNALFQIVDYVNNKPIQENNVNN